MAGGRLRPRTVCLLAAVLLSSCSVAKSVQPVPPAAAVGADRIDSIVRAMHVRERTLVSLKTGAVMEYRDDREHGKVREEIIAERPDKLRVEASSPFGVALILAVRGTVLQIFEPGNNVLIHGSASAATLNRFARIPLAPRSALSLLMALVPDAGRLDTATATMRNGMLVLQYHATDGTEREAGFVDRRLVMVRARDAGGQIRYEVHYTHYQNIGGVMFPYHVEADFPQAGSQVKLAYSRPIVNSAAPASLFVLNPAPNTREIDLDRIPAADGSPRG